MLHVRCSERRVGARRKAQNKLLESPPIIDGYRQVPVMCQSPWVDLTSQAPEHACARANDHGLDATCARDSGEVAENLIG